MRSLRPKLDGLQRRPIRSLAGHAGPATGIIAGNEPAALNAARPYRNTGLTELNAFLTAIGK